jgi:hypothetical protein
VNDDIEVCILGGPGKTKTVSGPSAGTALQLDQPALQIG